MIALLNGSHGLLHLPADSPVLIQSGFAMLAIAKISAARNRQPEMIVSLSISPADGGVKDVEGMWRSLFGRDPPSVERHRAAVIGPTSPPAFNRNPLLRFGCALFFQQRSSFASSKPEPPQLQKRPHKSVTFQMPVVAPLGNTMAHTAPGP